MKRPNKTQSLRRSRALGLALLAALSGGLLAACQKPIDQSAPVRIGYSAWPGWFPWQVTETKNLFSDAGVPVKMSLCADPRICAPA